MRRAADHSVAAGGFSLIELLVALAIVALVAAGLLNLAGESTRTAAHLETRALAAIVADNVTAEAMLAEPDTLARPADGRTRLGARDWCWTRRAIPAAGGDGLLRIDVEVTDPDGQLAAQAWAFR